MWRFVCGILIVTQAIVGCAQVQRGEAGASPRNVGGVLYADGFAGADLSVRMAAAFASQAGTRSAPTPSAMVMLAPNLTYTFAMPLELPNQTAAPYIERPVLDCRGATLVFTGKGSSPAVLVHGENANNSANGSGALATCAP